MVTSKHCDKEGMSLQSWQGLDKPEVAKSKRIELTNRKAEYSWVRKLKLFFLSDCLVHFYASMAIIHKIILVRAG